MKGYIHSFESFGAVDGPGLRFVIFMQGCPLRCQYCHNPDTWKVKTGNEISVPEIVNKVKSYSNYVKTGGVTISGGEPLLQAEFVHKLIKKLHKINVHVAIDTAGSLPLSVSRDVLSDADLILLDIKALDDELCKEITGASNKNTFETLDYLESINKPVWIRHVIVPGLTLQKEHLTNLAQKLKNYSCIEQIEILPFHKMGEFKWEGLDEPYKLTNTPTPTADQVKEAKQIFAELNLPVK